MMYKSLRCLLIITLLCLVPTISFSQEMLGLTMGNYKGIAGTMVNPASMTTNKVYLDINVASADVFFRNNFVYIPKEDFIIYDLFKKDYNFPTYGDDKRNILYYPNSKNKHVNENIRILGPSVMLQVGDHAFGITTGARVITSSNRIPYSIAELAYHGLEYTPLHNQDFKGKNLDFVTNSWMEVGLSYAYNVWKYYDQQLTVGISVKKLWGYAGGYTYSTDLEYAVPNDSTIDIQHMDAKLGFSAPMDYNNMDFLSGSPTFRGSGISLDFGFVYVKKKEVEMSKWNGKRLCSQKHHDYIYKIGVSIIDIGRVKYKNNAQLHSFDDISIYWEDIDTLGFDNMNSFLSEVSTTLYGNPNASYQDNKIKVGLPTALSIQADMKLRKDIYLAGFFIHPIRMNLNTIRRPAQLAVIPRYETRFFELSVPVSLYDYRYPRVGLAARFYFITIGTERLGTYLGMADMNGLDIYASIKIGINKNSCKKKFGGACSNNNFGNRLW